ncbi:YihY/virulence factor BrkB family protein [Qipengyuania sp. 6D47A]|uniref:YihY/virulence factor BrkB family protein n=2 Tax=Qipengyuania qiaonensis TaxID=2867240 RepID=A0ABS7J7M5_9SPHN|nr:YihY/virulence factor BrkB family protein [Qipengyuania qiaonensis]
MPKAAWKQILRRAWTMWGFHNLSLLGAGVAFFTFLALTPLIAATVMVYGLVGDVDTVQRQMQAIIEVVPRQAAAVIEDQLMGVVTANAGVTGLALVIALGFAIYGGMRAANGLIGALNIINEEHETRGIISLTFRAAALTLAAIFVALTGLISSGMFAWLQTQAGGLFGEAAEFAIKCLTWVASVLLGSAGFALIMRYGPDREPARWRWLAVGAMVATLLWIAVSFGFSIYVAYVSDYNATYGSLSAIVVFLMWLFLSAYGVLAGALLNAEIERQTTVDTTTGPELPIGERGAVLADLAEGGLSIRQWMEKAERRAVRRHLRSSMFISKSKV